MKSILVLSFVGLSHAWKPADLATLKTKVDACLNSASDGSQCYACDNGAIVSTSTASCADGSTPQFISDWDTSLVTSFNELFKDKSNFDQDLSTWDTSIVTDFSYMFRSTSFTNKSKPLLWDTSKVTTMAGMFYGSKFNQCLCNWDTSSVTSMRSMFYGNLEIKQDLSCWDISKVTDMSYMFKNTNNNNLCLQDSPKLNWNLPPDTTAFSI